MPQRVYTEILITNSQRTTHTIELCIAYKQLGTECSMFLFVVLDNKRKGNSQINNGETKSNISVIEGKTKLKVF